MHAYDKNDYFENPGKYKLFRSARIARHICTENGTNDLAAGEFVSIKYRCEAFNKMYGRYEPVYTIVNTEHGVPSEARDVYANNLASFVL
jgi:hypothetical protein